jgi:hypothetical protein
MLVLLRFCSIPNLDAPALLDRLEDGITDHRTAIPIFKSGVIGGHILVAHDGIQQMVHLMDESVLLTDDMAVRPQLLQKG